ncbi:MAG: hypothetical protein ACE5G5_13225 [Candidatus Methylomirabilales bacterium]
MKGTLLFWILWSSCAGLSVEVSDGQGSEGKVGILVTAHGGGPDWNAAVEAAVAPLREVCPIAVAFGMADPVSLGNGIRRLESAGVRRIAVVRLFVSAESFRHQSEYFLGVRPDPPERFLLHPGHQEGAELRTMKRGSAAAPLLISSREHSMAPVQKAASLILNREGLYDSSVSGQIILERVRGLSANPEEESILILAHGEGDERSNDRWLAKMDHLAGRIRAWGPFATVRVETLREDWKPQRGRAERRIRRFVEERSGRGEKVIVVPFRVFGFGPYKQVLAGLDYVANGRGLLPHPAITEWIRRQAGQCFRRAGWNDPFQPG